MVSGKGTGRGGLLVWLWFAAAPVLASTPVESLFDLLPAELLHQVAQSLGPYDINIKLRPLSPYVRRHLPPQTMPLFEICMGKQQPPFEQRRTYAVLWQALQVRAKNRSSCRRLERRAPWIYSLKLSGRKLRDVTALRYFPRIQQLNLARNTVSDLSPLGELKNLRILDVRDNLIEDFEPVKTLSQLGVLKASGNPGQPRS